MFTKILVPLDGSPMAEQAVPVAASLAGASRASIHYLLVHEHLRMPAHNTPDAYWNADERYLGRIAADTRSDADVPVTYAMPAGDPASVISDTAAEEHADLIVMTSHGRTGLSRAWLGSVADSVVRHSAVPVLLLRVGEPRPRNLQRSPHFRRILVALDGSTVASEAIAPAIELARCSGGSLMLLRVVQPVPMSTLSPLGSAASPMVEDEDATRVLVEEATRELTTLAHKLSSRVGNVETHVIVEAGIARAILDFADRHTVDAIAISSHGRGASRLLVGSIADKLLRGSTLPILLQRHVAVAPAGRWVTAGEVEQQLPALSSLTAR